MTLENNPYVKKLEKYETMFGGDFYYLEDKYNYDKSLNDFEREEIKRQMTILEQYAQLAVAYERGKSAKKD